MSGTLQPQRDDDPLVSTGTGGDLILPPLSIDPQLGIDVVLGGKDFLIVARACGAARMKVASADPLSS
jgi:hypothetical protein